MRLALSELLERAPGLELRGHGRRRGRGDRAVRAPAARRLPGRRATCRGAADRTPRGRSAPAAWTPRCSRSPAATTPTTVVEMLRAGACGYVVKGNGVDELVDALIAAASGRRPLSAQVAEGVVDVLSERLAREEAADPRRRRPPHRVAGDARPRQPLDGLPADRRAGLRAGVRVRGAGALLARAGPLARPWFAEAEAAGRLLEAELTAVAPGARASSTRCRATPTSRSTCPPRPRCPTSC